jgi:hypothetical protein
VSFVTFRGLFSPAFLAAADYCRSARIFLLWHFRLIVPAASAAMKPCALLCVKPASAQKGLCTPCSCVRGKGYVRKFARCRECSTSRWTKR